MPKASALARVERKLRSLDKWMPQSAKLNKANDRQNALIPNDWEQFAPKVNIQSGGRIIPFAPYRFQVDLIRAIERSPNTVICKSRQMGISETICSWILMRALTEPGFSGVVFSKTQKDSSDLGNRIRNMAVSLGHLCPAFETESKIMISFKGAGQLVFLPVTSRAARGIPSVSVLFFDEAAFIEGIEGVYQAAVPTMSMLGDAGRVIFNSTPNGKSGLFYELWTGDAPDWQRVELHYSLHPTYSADPGWAEKTKKKRKLTETQWQQEFELNFTESDVNVFIEEFIVRGARGTWQEPQPGRFYFVGIDSATGGADYFVATVWDVTETPYRLVGIYRERRKTLDYSLVCAAELIDKYMPILVCVESNSAGAVALESLTKLRPGMRFEGVVTTSTSKRVNTDRLVLLLERDFLIYPADSPLPAEMRNFRQDERGARNAAAGHHDDTIMSCAIAFALIDEMDFGPIEFSSSGKKRVADTIEDFLLM
jgi:Terminase RNaseH-like domain/Terminase large subunit, T4likevirus-type, N-terminal